MTKFLSKLLFISLFALIFYVRWTTLDTLLPQSWTPESMVGLTAIILEKPDYTDSKTIIHKGRWIIYLKGYIPIEIGRTYKFVGKVVPQVLLAKIIKIEMMDPTFEEVGRMQESPLRKTELTILSLGTLRERMTKILNKLLPEPHSSLAAGILLGVKGDIPYGFYQKLIKTGTMHVVAASGYNVTIVATVIITVLSTIFTKRVSLFMGIIGIVIYVIMSGGGAAVVRAGIMASFSLTAYFLGRQATAKRLLWLTGGLMLIVDPLLIVDIGYELSMMATIGLLYLEPIIVRIMRMKGFLKEYMSPTLAATIATLPITLIWFGRASLIGPLVNMLILPLVPLIMLLAAVTIGVGLVYIPAAYVVVWFTYVPLEIMIRVIELCG